MEIIGVVPALLEPVENTNSGHLCPPSFTPYFTLLCLPCCLVFWLLWISPPSLWHLNQKCKVSWPVEQYGVSTCTTVFKRCNSLKKNKIEFPQKDRECAHGDRKEGDLKKRLARNTNHNLIMVHNLLR